MSLYPETKTQMAVVQWLKLYHPEAFKHVIKIDNEGRRTGVGHAVAVKAGLHIGASDLFIAYPVTPYHGCFLEIKPDGWKLTPSKQKHYDSQMAFIQKMRRAGYAADLRIGVDECIEFLTSYLANEI